MHSFERHQIVHDDWERYGYICMNEVLVKFKFDSAFKLERSTAYTNLAVVSAVYKVTLLTAFQHPLYTALPDE